MKIHFQFGSGLFDDHFFFFIVNSFIIFFLINQTEAFIIRFFSHTFPATKQNDASISHIYIKRMRTSSVVSWTSSTPTMTALFPWLSLPLHLWRWRSLRAPWRVQALRLGPERPHLRHRAPPRPQPLGHEMLRRRLPLDDSIRQFWWWRKCQLWRVLEDDRICCSRFSFSLFWSIFLLIVKCEWCGGGCFSVLLTTTSLITACF